MFFIIDGSGSPVRLDDSPVFAICPECGVDHLFAEFWDAVCGWDNFDVYGTSVYCPECTRKHNLKREAGEQQKTRFRLLKGDKK